MPSVRNIIRDVAAVASTLSVSQQNGPGKPVWGTLEAPTFPSCLTNNPLPNGFPWGARTPWNTEPGRLDHIPNTGVTRHYNFTVARSTIAPDGVERPAILINGQFPGPQIEANWGDWIEVTVHNQISAPEEGTSIHWHGLLQKETPWYDGVPSVGQCPIAPGATYTYRYRADQFGTSWYHAHYSAQYTAGLYGPLIIYGPTNKRYDIDVGPVILNDWYHAPYFDLVSDVVGTDLTKIPPFSDNNLINGKNQYDCAQLRNTTYKCTPGAALSKFKFVKGKVHRLRLINTGADGLQQFSIDGHKLTVIAHDFVPVKPFEVEFVTLAIGQRVDVLVEGVGNRDGIYWMRSKISKAAACGLSHNGEAKAIVYYDKADKTQMPTTSAWPVDDACRSDPLASAVPEYAITPSVPAFTQKLAIALEKNATGNLVWSINNQTFRANFNHPILELASKGQVSFPENPQWNVYNFGKNSSIRFVLENPTPAAHPFHLHGHDFFVLADGNGTWDGTTIINAQNPARRDTHLVQAGGYSVFQIESNNPGVWPFHCHVAWHLSGGLSLNVMTHPDRIPNVPYIIDQTCKAWDDWTSKNVVEVVDAGS